MSCTFNRKVWNEEKFREFGLKKEAAKNMVKYFEKEAFPKFGREFCELAKQTSYFLGDKITVQKKNKPNFILSNVELILFSALLIDLVKNDNQILSYEYDGVIFEGELPENKREVYTSVCKNLLGFIIPISTDQIYPSVKT